MSRAQTAGADQTELSEDLQCFLCDTGNTEAQSLHNTGCYGKPGGHAIGQPPLYFEECAQDLHASLKCLAIPVVSQSDPIIVEDRLEEQSRDELSQTLSKPINDGEKTCFTIHLRAY